MAIDPEMVSKVMAELGRKGGAARSAKKAASSRLNLRKALEARLLKRGQNYQYDEN